MHHYDDDDDDDNDDNDNNNNNNGFICIAARMLDFTISAMHKASYENNVTYAV